MRSMIVFALFGLLALTAVSANNLFDIESDLDNAASAYSNDYSLMATGSGVTYGYSITSYTDTMCNNGASVGQQHVSGTCAAFSSNYTARIDCTPSGAGYTYTTNQQLPTDASCPTNAGAQSVTAGVCSAGSNTGLTAYIVNCFTVATSSSTGVQSSSTGTSGVAHTFSITPTNNTDCSGTAQTFNIGQCYSANNYFFAVTCPSTSTFQITYAQGSCPSTTNSATAIGNQATCYPSPSAIATQLPFTRYSVKCDNFVAGGSAFSMAAPSMLLMSLLALFAMLF